MKRAVFLDRDGVINDVINRGGGHFTAPFEYSEFRLKVFVRESLSLLKRMGFLRILVTNQPDMAYGLTTKEEHKRIMSEVVALGFDDIFVCYHTRNDNCDCKKPKPGMLLLAQKKWNIELTKSYLIGDTVADMNTGKVVGCKTILIESSYNKETVSDHKAGNLLEAVRIIKNRK